MSTEVMNSQLERQIMRQVQNLYIFETYYTDAYPSIIGIYDQTKWHGNDETDFYIDIPYHVKKKLPVELRDIFLKEIIKSDESHEGSLKTKMTYDEFHDKYYNNI